MTGSVARSLLLSLFPCIIPPYAFRLARVFGMKRVGWMLFSVFSLLGVLQVFRFWPMRLGLDPVLTIDLLNFLIPVLLLIGMVHIETVFKGRLRLEEDEKRLRSELESTVQQRTSDLDKANEELQREISLRKQGEQELKKSKEQYRFLFDENPQPMWIYDRGSFRFLAFNSATLRHYGYTRSEFVTMTAKELCPSGELEAFIADSVKSSPEVQRRGLWKHLRKDGSILEVELTALDLVYAGYAARLVLVSDVTAQRMLQKQMLRSQRAEVTAQLAGGVADNFNKLIGAIESDADGLAEHCQDRSATEPLKRIAATAASASALNRQLMALVRRHPMRPLALDLNQFLTQQAGMLGRWLRSNINVETVFWPNLPGVMADPALVEQILRNLVLNARDAMPEGGTLTLSTAAVRIDEDHASKHEGVRPGTYVCLTVGDTGCGMSPEVESHLFEPFFTTKGAGKGTGLGLATVHGLAKQHGGFIEVRTELGEGSQLAVYFPCVPHAAPAAAFAEGAARAEY